MRAQFITFTLVLLSAVAPAIAVPVPQVPQTVPSQPPTPEWMVKEFIAYSEQASTTDPNDEDAVQALMVRYNNYPEELRDVIDNVNDGVLNVMETFKNEEVKYASLDDQERLEAIGDLTTTLTHAQETFFITYLMKVFDPSEASKYRSRIRGSLHPDVQAEFDKLELDERFNLVRYALALDEVVEQSKIIDDAAEDDTAVQGSSSVEDLD